MNSFSDIHFDNSFMRELPGDSQAANQRRQVHAACYSPVKPAIVKSPALLAYSSDLAKQLGFADDFVTSSEFLQAFSGNKLLSGMQPFAMCYGGHQFGQWAGQLGDGRAINLGELIDQNGQRQTLQLKGAGPTPYSRTADGLAVLRSSVREFLCSEAMFYLGVPTTRALSLISTGEQVMRDMFYDGRAAFEPGAIVCRVAPSFIRFGNFELLASRQDLPLLKKLADYTITTFFPHLISPSSNALDKNTYIAWFQEVCDTTAALMVEWQRVGFVHGVMNTDNMSIHGLTIDYGPYGWLEDYNPDWTPNTTDAQHRRYRFANQPGIAQWNLAQLANAIYPLIDDAEILQTILSEFGDRYHEQWQTMMLKKMGLGKLPTDDAKLIDDLLALLTVVETDVTLFFRRLADVPCEQWQAKVDQLSGAELTAPLHDCFYLNSSNGNSEPPSEKELPPEYVQKMGAWLRRYVRIVTSQRLSDDARREAMNKVNPLYVLRNYLAQLAIDKAADGNNELINEMLDVLRNPYDEQPGKERFAEKRPEWARQRPGCSMLSCSS